MGCISCIGIFPSNQIMVPSPPIEEIKRYIGKKPVLLEHPTLEDIKAFYIFSGYNKGFEEGYKNGYTERLRESQNIYMLATLGGCLILGGLIFSP